jgi:hypothetical protein
MGQRVDMRVNALQCVSGFPGALVLKVIQAAVPYCSAFVVTHRNKKFNATALPRYRATALPRYRATALPRYRATEWLGEQLLSHDSVPSVAGCHAASCPVTRCHAIPRDPTRSHAVSRGVARLHWRYGLLQQSTHQDALRTSSRIAIPFHAFSHLATHHAPRTTTR